MKTFPSYLSILTGGENKCEMYHSVFKKTTSCESLRLQLRSRKTCTITPTILVSEEMYMPCLLRHGPGCMPMARHVPNKQGKYISSLTSTVSISLHVLVLCMYTRVNESTVVTLAIEIAHCRHFFRREKARATNHSQHASYTASHAYYCVKVFIFLQAQKVHNALTILRLLLTLTPIYNMNL